MMVTRGWVGGWEGEGAGYSDSLDPRSRCPSVSVTSSEDMRQFCASSGFIAFAHKRHLFTGYLLGRSVSSFYVSVRSANFPCVPQSSAQTCFLSNP